MANRDNQPTVDIGAVEVALALMAVTAFMMQYHLQQLNLNLTDCLLFVLEGFTFLWSALTAMVLSRYYIEGKISDLTDREVYGFCFPVLKPIGFLYVWWKFGKETAVRWWRGETVTMPMGTRRAHILFYQTVFLFSMTLTLWVYLIAYRLLRMPR